MKYYYKNEIHKFHNNQREMLPFTLILKGRRTRMIFKGYSFRKITEYLKGKEFYTEFELVPSTTGDLIGASAIIDVTIDFKGGVF